MRENGKWAAAPDMPLRQVFTGSPPDSLFMFTDSDGSFKILKKI